MSGFDPSTAAAVSNDTKPGFDPASATAVSAPAPAAKPFDPHSAAPAGSFAAVKQQKTSFQTHEIAAESSARGNLEYAQQHPLESVFDVLGAGQRAVGAAVGAAEHHEGLGQTLGDVWHDVWHPGDKNAQGVDATQRDTEAIRALVGAPTHASIDAWVQKYAPKEIQPYASAVAKGVEDMALQTLSDPLTYAGGFGAEERLFKAAGTLLHGAANTKAMLWLAQHAGTMKYIGPMLSKLGKFYAESADHIGNLVKTRPELDKILTGEGRAARIQIENKHLTLLERNRAADEAGDMADNAHVTARAQHYTSAMGVPPRSARTIQQHVLAASPEERAQMLEQMRRKLYARDVNAETANHLGTTHATGTAMYKPGVMPMSADDWQRFAQSQNKTLRDMLRGSPQGKSLLWATQIPRRMQQASLFLNPLPHGIKNVGMLAYMAGGPRVIPKAFKAMMTGLSVADKDRLARIGLEPGYTQNVVHTLWDAVPGWRGVTGTMQSAMARMEEGWRSALLDVADRKFGPTRTMQDEYRKANWVNEHVGDYRNQNAIVQAFQMLGGPWVAFRLGIVPKNVLETIKLHPERILAIARAQEDMQRNRSAEGQHSNDFQIGGPITDFAKLATNPVQFFTSPATMGALGQVGKAASDLGHTPAGKVAGEFAAGFDPFGGMEGIGKALAGRAMPLPGAVERYQPQTLADRLVTATLASLAMYFYRQKSEASQKYDLRERQRIERQSKGFGNDFLSGIAY